jgi:hypothetical protein
MQERRHLGIEGRLAWGEVPSRSNTMSFFIHHPPQGFARSTRASALAPSHSSIPTGFTIHGLRSPAGLLPAGVKRTHSDLRRQEPYFSLAYAHMGVPFVLRAVLSLNANQHARLSAAPTRNGAWPRNRHSRNGFAIKESFALTGVWSLYAGRDQAAVAFAKSMQANA